MMLAALHNCSKWRESGLKRQHNVVSAKMYADIGVVLSPGDQTRLNNGKKRKIKVQEWKDKHRKACRDSGKPYISKWKKAVSQCP